MSKSNNASKGIVLGAVILGIVAVAMIFFPNIMVKDSDPVEAYTGLQIVFGYKEVQASLGSSQYVTEWFKFSTMNLITYILILAGVVLSVMNAMGSGSKLVSLIAGGCYIVGAVFMFMVVNFSIIGKGQFTGVLLLDKNSLVLAWGAYVGGIASALAGVLSLGKLIM